MFLYCSHWFVQHEGQIRTKSSIQVKHRSRAKLIRPVLAKSKGAFLLAIITQNVIKKETIASSEWRYIGDTNALKYQLRYQQKLLGLKN